MALVITSSKNFIEISLDGATDFDVTTDLVGLGLEMNAYEGLRVRKVVFIPSDTDDEVIVRDGENGPGFFRCPGALGVWDILKDEYREDGKPDVGKLVKVYIHAGECVIAHANLAYVLLEL